MMEDPNAPTFNTVEEMLAFYEGKTKPKKKKSSKKKSAKPVEATPEQKFMVIHFHTMPGIPWRSVLSSAKEESQNRNPEKVAVWAHDHSSLEECVKGCRTVIAESEGE